MSVQHNTYVIWGVVFPYSPFAGSFDVLEPYVDKSRGGIHHHKGVCVLFDGMNGKYVIVGRVLAKSRVDQGLECPPIELRQLTELEQGLITDAIDNVANLLPAARSQNPQFIVLTHYR